ncbi:MAG: hypothetical protein AB1295_01770 [Candidatus Micrarchaeota archaeon]
MKGKGRRPMEYLFVLMLVVGALGVQLANGWLSKNEFDLANFAMMVPLILFAQYFIAWGYHDGTSQSGFITTHIIWTGVLIAATLAINYIIFQSMPNPTNLFALLLAGAAAVIAVMGK